MLRYQPSAPFAEDTALLKKYDPNVKQSLLKMMFAPAKYSKQIQESFLIPILLFFIGKNINKMNKLNDKSELIVIIFK